MGRLRRRDVGRGPGRGEVKRLCAGLGADSSVVHPLRRLNGRTWDSAAGYAASATYNADVYVFALVTARDHTSYDPLDLAQWTFWVLLRRIVEATGQRSMALSRVQELAVAPVTHDGLAQAVRAAAQPGGGP